MKTAGGTGEIRAILCQQQRVCGHTAATSELAFTKQSTDATRFHTGFQTSGEFAISRIPACRAARTPLRVEALQQGAELPSRGFGEALNKH